MPIAHELRLKWLSSNGPDRWIYKNLLFDMVGVRDDYLNPWTVQGLETGIEASFSSAAVRAEVNSLTGSGRPRTIRMFSDGAGFIAGTGQPNDSRYGSFGASGASSWLPPIAHRDKPNEKPTPPADRTDLKVFLNPTGGSGMSLPSEDGSQHPTYSYLVGTLWHELHHLAAADYEQHLRASPPYEPYWQDAMSAIRAGFPAMAWDPIKRAMVPLWTSQWASIACNHAMLA